MEEASRYGARRRRSVASSPARTSIPHQGWGHTAPPWAELSGLTVTLTLTLTLNPGNEGIGLGFGGRDGFGTAHVLCMLYAYLHRYTRMPLPGTR